MQVNPSLSCTTYTYPSETSFSLNVGVFALATETSFTTNSRTISLASAGVTDSALTVLNSQTQACTIAQSTYTLNAPTITAVTHDISSATPTIYTFTAFSYAETCSNDPFFIYTSRLNSGLAFPSFISFYGPSRRYTMSTTSVGDVGSYATKLIGYAPNG